MAKSTSSQKVIEAEANLESAKMLESITELKKSMEMFDSKFSLGWNRTEEQSAEEIFAPIEAIKRVMIAVKRAQKDCAIKNNAKIVEDVINGIRLRSQYEIRIAELEEGLRISTKNNELLQDEINKLKGGFKEIIDKIIDEKPSKEVVEAFMLKFSTDVQEKSVVFAMRAHLKHILEEKAKHCKIEEPVF